MNAPARVASALAALGLSVGVIPFVSAVPAAASPATAVTATTVGTVVRGVAPVLLRGRFGAGRSVVDFVTPVRSGRVAAVAGLGRGCSRLAVTLGKGRRVVASGTGSAGLAVAGRVAAGRMVVRVTSVGCVGAFSVTVRQPKTLATPMLPRNAFRSSGYVAQAARVATGTLTRSRPAVAVRVPGVVGGVSAVVTYRKCSPLTMSLRQGGHTLASGSGASGLAVAGSANPGTVTVVIASNRCRTPFAVRVSSPSTATPVLVTNTRGVTTAPPAAAPVAPVAASSPTLPSAPSPTLPPWTHVPVTEGTSVLTFGAVGDGVTDDTVAVQKALDSLTPGDTLVFPAGAVFAHSDVLSLRVPGVTLGGTGTLLATNEARSSVLVDADDVTVDGITLRITATTKRWETYEQMKLRLGAHAGIVVRGVTVDGSAAAGIYIGGASRFTLDHVTVQNTRADGIHMTEASHDGTVVAPVVRNTGDDGVAVVSYANQSGPVNHITVTSPRFFGQTWGRGFSVVGGEDITYSDVYAEHSNGAAIYISAEASWNTMGVKRVLIDGGSLVSSNDNVTSDHGAILLYNGQARYAISDVTVQNVTVWQTRRSASRQVGVLSDGSATQRHISLRNIAVVGGPTHLFAATVPTSSYNATGWTFNGSPVSDKVGWA